MEKISIIGGSGFLGESLTHSCSKKNLDFAILDINKPKIYQDKYSKFNVCDKDNHDLIKGDIIINLAAEHRDDVKPLSKYSEVNIGGAHNICAIAEKKGINTIVFFQQMIQTKLIFYGSYLHGRLAIYQKSFL